MERMLQQIAPRLLHMLERIAAPSRRLLDALDNLFDEKILVFRQRPDRA
jgi:hypothetical protein